MSIYSRVEFFLKGHTSVQAPFLLALSGGADSLCLFHCLLAYRRAHGVPFHVAHVDHGWREESGQEARQLECLANEHQAPFHLKRLDPSGLTGNLEAACREERYAFFAAICKEHHCQGVLTGHHQNDQAETIFKRILEGAHWSRWNGLLPESRLHGVRVLRPLLDISKSEITQALSNAGIIPFEDPTNRNVHYLRARFRESLFPRLNREFGKDVQGSFIEIGAETRELNSYFEGLVAPLIKGMIRGPWGICLDLGEAAPLAYVVIKFLLRHLCREEGFFFSRTILEQATEALIKGSANLRFETGIRQLIIDRKRLFILAAHMPPKENQVLKVEPGTSVLRGWKIEVVDAHYQAGDSSSPWKESWQGKMTIHLPKTNYRIGWDSTHAAHAQLKKKWSQAKIPAFLTNFFPLLYCGAGGCYEFLTGRGMASLKSGDPCWKIMLTYEDNSNRV